MAGIQAKEKCLCSFSFVMLLCHVVYLAGLFPWGGEGGGGGERERENSNSKTLFGKGCSLVSVKNLTTSPC